MREVRGPADVPDQARPGDTGRLCGNGFGTDGFDTSGFDTGGFDPGGFDTGGFDTDGFDTDGDGRPDTMLRSDGVDLVLLTDLDGDGLAEQVLRIGPDAVVRLQGPEPAAGPGGGVLDGLLGGAAAGCDT